MSYCVKRGLIAQSVDGELLILNRQQEKIHQLNPVASFIWENLDGCATKEQLLKAITEKYDVEQDVAKNDLESLLNEFSDLNLIEVI